MGLCKLQFSPHRSLSRRRSTSAFLSDSLTALELSAPHYIIENLTCNSKFHSKLCFPSRPVFGWRRGPCPRTPLGRNSAVKRGLNQGWTQRGRAATEGAESSSSSSEQTENENENADEDESVATSAALGESVPLRRDPWFPTESFRLRPTAWQEGRFSAPDRLPTRLTQEKPPPTDRRSRSAGAVRRGCPGR